MICWRRWFRAGSSELWSGMGFDGILALCDPPLRNRQISHSGKNDFSDCPLRPVALTTPCKMSDCMELNPFSLVPFGFGGVGFAIDSD